MAKTSHNHSIFCTTTYYNLAKYGCKSLMQVVLAGYTVVLGVHIVSYV